MKMWNSESCLIHLLTIETTNTSRSDLGLDADDPDRRADDHRAHRSLCAGMRADRGSGRARHGRVRDSERRGPVVLRIRPRSVRPGVGHGAGRRVHGMRAGAAGGAAVPVRHGGLPDCGGSGGTGVRRDHSPACGLDHGLFRAAPLRGELRVQHEPAHGRLGVRAVHRRPDPGMVRRLPRGPLCGCGHNPAGRRPGGCAQGKGP